MTPFTTYSHGSKKSIFKYNFQVFRHNDELLAQYRWSLISWYVDSFDRMLKPKHSYVLCLLGA